MSLLPRTLFGRLVLLLASGLVIAQLIGAAMHMAERQNLLSTTVNAEFAQRVAAVYRAINHQPAAERLKLTQLLSAPRQQLTLESEAPAVPGNLDENEFIQRVRAALGADVALQPLTVPRPGEFSFDLYLQLTSGDWLRIKGQAPPEIFALPVHHFLTLGVMLAMMGLVHRSLRSLDAVAPGQLGLLRLALGEELLALEHDLVA